MSRKLADWLKYIEAVHTAEIALGLDRVGMVAARLDLLEPTCPVITIGGTNGKGSCVAGLEAIYRAAGYKVAAFTSPYLLRLNEEIRVDRIEATDAAICEALAAIEAARGDIPLTVFEFKTLAALWLFSRQNQPDVMLLEVGLGGRLDAVNIIAADVAIVASIAIDHADRLGATRELIAREKAGIFRPGKPAVCGEIAPPETLLQHAVETGTPLYRVGEAFHYREQPGSWEWQSEKNHFTGLPRPPLLLQNMATVLMAVELLQARLPVARAAIDQALATVTLTGRMQIIPGEITQILDVSHNPAAAAQLAEKLRTLPCQGKTIAVFAMLGDKDITATVQEISAEVDEWYVAPLAVKRGATAAMLTGAIAKAGVEAVKVFDAIATAYEAAMQSALVGDRVVVFGSFYTVAAVLA